MKKYKLVVAVLLLSTIVVANKGNIARCDEYWNPKIDEAEDLLQQCLGKWRDMSYREQHQNPAFLDSCAVFEQLLEWTKAQNTKCYEKGFKKKEIPDFPKYYL